MSKLLKRLVRLLVAGVVLGATTAGLAGQLSASTYNTQPFETEGTVVPTSTENGGAAVDAAGTFSLDDLSRSVGPLAEASANDGTVRIDPKIDTVYLVGDGNGGYRSGTRAQVVVPGARLFVAGRAFATNAGYEFIANYVWNPPPTSTGGSVANPKPDLPADLGRQRPFFVDATVTETGVTLINSLGWSSATGFTVGSFTEYGTDHVEKITLAHADHLRLYYLPYTKYWTADGAASDRATVVRYGQTVHVTGQYRWDGNDWRFFATNVFNPPPTTASGGPLATTAELVQTGGGTYKGTSTANFDANASADMTMTLTWTHEDNGDWSFTGTYSAVKQGSSNSIAGSITGLVVNAPVPTVTANMTVDHATGAWAGWTGYGSLKGTAAFPAGTTSSPSSLGGNFAWTVGP